MFRRIGFLCFFILSFIDVLLAQKVQLGFRLEPTVLRAQYGSDSTSYSEGAGLQFNLSVFPLEWLAFEGRASITPFMKNYTGGETGLFVKLYHHPEFEYLKSVYITGGYIFHKVTGDAHNEGGSLDTQLNMSAFGIGINPIGTLNLELLYLYTDNQKVGIYYYYPSISSPRAEKDITVRNIIKLGIGFSWDIFSWSYK